VLDCNTERIYDVLKQAQQIGMMSDYHSYLITSLDLHSVDLEEFKYGGTNITALRLVDPEKPELQKVVRNWVYGELRYGRKLDLPPPRVRIWTVLENLSHLLMHTTKSHFIMVLCVSGQSDIHQGECLSSVKNFIT
jgi:hypothetical protein